MHKVIFNPFTHNLQFIRKDTDTSIVSGNTITECSNNREYIVDSLQLEEFILPRFSSHRDYIKIYGRNDFGWRLHIPDNVEIICPHRKCKITSDQYIESKHHQYDFLSLIYIKSCWLIENYSKSIEIKRDKK